MTDVDRTLDRALAALKKARVQLTAAENQRSEPIAVVALACRLPGGVTTPEAFLELLRGGRRAIAEVPPERWAGRRSTGPGSRWAALLDDVHGFDAGFFEI